MEAAKTALAPPLFIASYKCSNLPAPPEAITGMFIEVVILLSSSKSYPVLVPSLSIEVSRISPAPFSSACLEKAIASIPVFSLPP